MSEHPRIDGDSVYGGSMTPQEFLKAEFAVDDEVEKFTVIPNENAFVAKINGYEIQFNYHNTRVYLHDEHEMFDHVYVKREGKPIYIFRPDGEAEGFNSLIYKCAEMEFDFYEFGRAKPNDMENLYRHWRGGEDIDSIIERILDE